MFLQLIGSETKSERIVINGNYDTSTTVEKILYFHEDLGKITQSKTLIC